MVWANLKPAEIPSLLKSYKPGSPRYIFLVITIYDGKYGVEACTNTSHHPIIISRVQQYRSGF
jgi:hypothetical protein